MKKLILPLFSLITISGFTQIQFTSVDPSTQTLIIQNFGTDEMDISTYRLCSLFDYTFSGIEAETNLISGDFVLAQNETLTIQWLAASGFVSAGVGADINLYLPSGGFNNSANMVCFMQYGSGGNGREPQAVAAGLWAAGTFVIGDGPFIYTGNGTESGVEFWMNVVPPQTDLVINELDSDTPSADLLEFIELLGAPNEILDGLVVVFYNGSNDFSYDVYDLDGYSCDENGFFVMGNAAVANVDFVYDDNALQNGADAVAVYFGNGADFPNGSVVSISNLVDALVYDTGDPDDIGLLPLMEAGGQANEEGSGDAINHALARIPDGGEQLNSSTYIAQTPTPGYTNIIPLCDGGLVLTDGGSSQETVCIDDETDIITFAHMSTQPNATYAYFLTDTDGLILTFPAGDQMDFNDYSPGTYFVKGISYYGNIDPATVEEGDDPAGIVADGQCVDVSDNAITIIIQVCEFVEGCTELFFSEYLEGLSNNKAIEIFNPTNLPVDLSDYAVFLYANGTTDVSNILGFTEMLGPGESYVIALAAAEQAILDLANTTATVAQFNGNDAIELRHSNVPVDVLGVVGQDPGTAWTVSSGSTANYGLVRKPNVAAPTTDWVLSSSQWLVYEPTDFTHLGAHAFIPCETSMPVLDFTQSAYSVEENAGTVEVAISVYNPLYSVEVQVDITGGSATENDDYTDLLPVTLTFPQGSNEPQYITVNIVDDLLEENSTESIEITMTGDAGQVILLSETTNVFILPSDPDYPLYTIADAAATDADGIAENSEVDCELRGVVHGINFNEDGLQFTLIDPTDGIMVFKTLDNLGYIVQEGDSIHVKGYIFQFMGQMEINADSLLVISGDNELEVPTTVTQLNEDTESHLVTIECVTLSNAAQWTNTSSGFAVALTDGDNVYTMYVDGDTDLYGDEAPQGHFTVTGIGHQFDTTEPYLSDYEVWPTGAADLTDFVIASFDDPGTIQFWQEDVTINFNNTSAGGTEYEWDFGDGGQSYDENPSHNYSVFFLGANPNFYISLTVTNGNCSDTYILNVHTLQVGVNELLASQTSLFPNPAHGLVHIVAPCAIQSVVITNSVGQAVKYFTTTTSQLDMDLNDISAGMYQVDISTAKGVVRKKLVVN